SWRNLMRTRVLIAMSSDFSYASVSSPGGIENRPKYMATSEKWISSPFTVATTGSRAGERAGGRLAGAAWVFFSGAWAKAPGTSDAAKLAASATRTTMDIDLNSSPGGCRLSSGSARWAVSADYTNSTAACRANLVQTGYSRTAQPAGEAERQVRRPRKRRG